MLCPYCFNSYICTCLRKASIVPLWILIQSYLYGIERNIKLPLTHAETCEEGILVMVVTNIKRSVFIIAIAITSLNQLLLYCCHIIPLNRDAVGLKLVFTFYNNHKDVRAVLHTGTV